MSDDDNVFAALALLFFFVGSVAILMARDHLRRRLHRVTVEEHSEALLYRDGAFVRPLPAGRQRVHRQRDTVVTVDRRTRISQLRGQEVLTADGVSVKVSLDLELRVVDARTAVGAALSGFGGVSEHGALELVLSAAGSGLRDAVTVLEFERVMEARESIADAVLTAARARAADVGIEVDTAVFRDLVLPAPIKKLLAAQVHARIEGLAALERARAEHATMRSLANTARLVAQHPELGRVRMLQEMSAADRPTFVINVDAMSGGASAPSPEAPSA